MVVTETEQSSLLLDDKLLQLMDQLELLEEKRHTLNSLIEQGWFSISKARYSMGNKQVSTLQYASEIEPLVCVHTRTLENGEAEFCMERVVKKSHKESEEHASFVEDIGPKEQGLRKRNNPTKDLTGKEERDKAKREMPTTEKVLPKEDTPVIKDLDSHQDPLKWFGILVPQSLKQAQSSFKQVIELSAEIAALQSTVIKTSEELKLGMKQKHSSSLENTVTS